VVSDIIDKLSPNIAPPTTVAIDKAIEISVDSEIPTPTGANAATVPMDVPIATEIKAPTMNKPASKNRGGINDKPRLTVELTAPLASAVSRNGRANKNTKTIN